MTLKTHATRSQLLGLIEIFGRLLYNEDGEQHIDVPEWLRVMWEASEDDL